MSDLTIYAEALISAMARAFYEDEHILLVDILIAQKFLRDDDMAPRLSLPAKKLRTALQFLQEEHLVRCETVDDLAQGGSQATKFYYLDYNRAVHSIRLRLLLLQEKLKDAERQASNNSYYLCPGNPKRCLGRYTEEEAQKEVDSITGRFLCQDCKRNFENDPLPTPAYTLQLVDNTKALRIAVDNMRRFNLQMTSKTIDNATLRPSIFDLVQKVRGGGHHPHQHRDPVTSNLPSENFALDIGSKRLEGTGRTAGIKAKKLEQQGVAASAAQAKKYLVGGPTGGNGDAHELFLKNALGHEVRFAVERGGGDRARFLASRKSRRHKLMDAAASRVGSALPLHMSLEENRKRKLEQAAAAKKDDGKKKDGERKLMRAGDTFFFLKDNIGRKQGGDEPEEESQQQEKQVKRPELEAAIVESSSTMNDSQLSLRNVPSVVLTDDVEELRKVPDDVRLKSFQTEYKIQMDRQIQLLQGQYDDIDKDDPFASPRHSILSTSEDEKDVMWEDGGTEVSNY